MIFRNIPDAILKLNSAVKQNDTFIFYVQRDNVLSDAFKRMTKPTFGPTKKLIVWLCYTCVGHDFLII